MAKDIRQRDAQWRLHVNDDGTYPAHEARLAVLMDIRDELKAVAGEMRRLNAVFNCSNFLEVPRILRSIRRNTAKPRTSRS